MKANAMRLHGSNLIVRRESPKRQQNSHERSHRNGYNKRRRQNIDQQLNQIVGADTFAHEELGQPEDFVKQQDGGKADKR